MHDGGGGNGGSRADRRDLSEGQIDAPGQAEDQRIRDRQQPVDGGSRQSREELLQEIRGSRRDLGGGEGGGRSRVAGDPLRAVEIVALQQVQAGARQRTLLRDDLDQFGLVGRQTFGGEATDDRALEDRTAGERRLILNLQASRHGPGLDPPDGNPRARIEGRERRAAHPCLLRVERRDAARQQKGCAKKGRRPAEMS